MKQIIIATAIALAFPAISNAVESEQSPAVVAPAAAESLVQLPAPEVPNQMRGATNSPTAFELLKITPDQETAWNAYAEASKNRREWENPIGFIRIDSKSVLIAKANKALRELVQTKLTPEQAYAVLNPVEANAPEYIKFDLVAKEAGMTTKQRQLFETYIRAGAEVPRLEAQYDKALFDARKKLVDVLTFEQTRLALKYGLIDEGGVSHSEIWDLTHGSAR